MPPTKNENPPRRVFLSHSSKDADAAAAIRQSLFDHGVEVWSSQNIMPGDNIVASIQREINDADDVLILMSPSSEASSWMEYEAAAALAARESGKWRKRIIPVLLDPDAQPPPILERFNYLDLSAPGNWQEGLDRLVRTIGLEESSLTTTEEERLEREHLAGERLALEQARMSYATHIAIREGFLRLALGIAAFSSVFVLLLLSILGVFGQISEIIIAILGAVAGVLITPLIAERRG